MFKFFKNWLLPQRQTQPIYPQNTFILEPILTPSGLLDGGDDSLFDLIDSIPDSSNDGSITVDNPDFLDFSTDDIDNTPPNLDDFEEKGFFPIDEPEIEPHLDNYTSGIFTVGDSGQVEIDYLWDGGKYQGQLALFNLQGLDDYEPGSREFILEVLNRVLEPNSETGHVVIDDKGEGAKFSGEVGERNFNKDDYTDIKTLNLQPGTHWGAMLIPNGTAEELWETLNDPDTKLPRSLRPLFSLATANPDDGLHLGQIADVTGDGHTFVFEDLRVDGRTDRDYNDIIFQIQGATGDAVELDEVIDPANDWRETETGQALIDYATFEPSPLPIDPETGVEYIPNELLIKFDADSSDSEIAQIALAYGATEVEPLIPPNSPSNSPLQQWRLLTFNASVDVANLRTEIAREPGVEVTELNGVRSLHWQPNDSEFQYQWGLHNTGQQGTRDADIDALEAWELQRGNRDVTVAVIDTGVDYTHQDLAANMWQNPGEIAGDGLDNDGNGYIDDIYGYDFGNSDRDPIPEQLHLFDREYGYGHGTHVAGIIGAVGNNNVGVVGVSPNVSLMALNARDNAETLKSGKSVLTQDALARAISYAVDNGANIINASFAGNPFSLIEFEAIRHANEQDVLFVTSAGNDAANNDVVEVFPANYNLPNIISVAATDRDDRLWSRSNYGANTVDLGAPGDGILSTFPENQYDSGSGTSMAAPHVAGAAALLLAEDSTLSPTELKNILINTADKNDSLQSKTTSGKRLNLYNILQVLQLQGMSSSEIAEFLLHMIGEGMSLSEIAEFLLHMIGGEISSSEIAEFLLQMIDEGMSLSEIAEFLLQMIDRGS